MFRCVAHLEESDPERFPNIESVKNNYLSLSYKDDEASLAESWHYCNDGASQY